jgi:hypothetical protein
MVALLFVAAADTPAAACERKTHTDFAVSLADGRLFLQAAKLARCPHRPCGMAARWLDSWIPVREHALCSADTQTRVLD